MMYQKPEDWRSLFEAVIIELPLGMQRLLLGAADAGVEVEQSVSKAHHSWINLANAMFDALYVRTGFWEAVLDNFNSVLRVQRLAQSAAKVFVAALGPSIGLASISEVDALQDEIIRLRRELKELQRKLESHPGAEMGLRRVK
jgi:hypothetical protein